MVPLQPLLLGFLKHVNLWSGSSPTCPPDLSLPCRALWSSMAEGCRGQGGLKLDCLDQGMCAEAGTQPPVGELQRQNGPHPPHGSRVVHPPERAQRKALDTEGSAPHPVWTPRSQLRRLAEVVS